MPSFQSFPSMGSASLASVPAMKFFAMLLIWDEIVLVIIPLATPPALRPRSMNGGALTPGWVR